MPEAPHSKADYAYESLKSAIRNGSIPAGSQLRAAAYAESLGVSVTPVREALRRLEIDGLISYEAHHGARVNDLSEGAVIEFYHVRAAVEGVGARLAAGRATPEQLAPVEEIHNRMVAAHRAGELTGLGELSWTFHLAVAEIGGPEYLAHQVASIRDSVPIPNSSSLWLDPDAAAHDLQAHADIIAALRTGDADQAEAVMSSHILHALEWRRRHQHSA